MSVVLFAARIDGPCDDHLSVHSTFEGAVMALLEVGRALHLDRFSYVPSSLVRAESLRGLAEPHLHEVLRRAEDTLTGSGWRGRVVELEVDRIETETSALL